jgi:tRNA pseudouridine38-40 synthase
LRYFIALSYNGKHYHGWQTQPNAVTVQQTIEEALSTLLRDKISILGAGRTDAGVHARLMYAHFDYTPELDVKVFIHQLNSFLPSAIAIKDIYPVIPDAHARFDAVKRSYTYWVVQQKDPFLQDYAYYLRADLDIATMNKAAAILLETKDFQCFSKSNTDVKTYICDVQEAHWQQDDSLLVFHITADRFLRNMVRAVVGTLIEVGLGRCSISQFKQILKSKDRRQAGVSVPAQGLYLTEVQYPKNIFL